MQQDPDTSELHFALGDLFRKRGEYERAVRVHQHLLGRADLSKAERDQAQHGLAQDYMKAGLFDRAEEAYQALAGTSFDTEARLALLDLHERSRDWRAAAAVAAHLEQSGSGSFASRIAHYHCELALEADAAGQRDGADVELALARDAAPSDARPLVLSGELAAARGDHGAALGWWNTLMSLRPAAFNLVAKRYATSARHVGDDAARWAGCRRSTTRRRRSTCSRPSRCSSPTTRRGASACSRICASSRASARRRPCSARRRATQSAAAPAGSPARARGLARERGRRRARRRPARRPAAPSLPLRRLRLRGRALFLAVPGLPRLGHVSSATTGGPLKPTVPTRDQLKSARVLVVGDAMLDRYWFGAVDRISPEAPVPVVRVNPSKEQERLGGAANVAWNVKVLGAHPSLLTAIGDDEHGHRLEGLLEKSGIETLFKRDPRLTTIVKLRVIGRSQQLLRVDFEEEPDHEVLDEMRPLYERRAGRREGGPVLRLRQGRADPHPRA